MDVLNDNSNLPSVSVIAPCRNEVGFVRQAVEAILENDYPPELMEVLVVDGMSEDGTREIVEEMAEKNGRIRLLDNPAKITPLAMNTGIDAATGKYIVRIDCHSVFANDYIRKCIEVSQRTCADNVGGYIETVPGDDTVIAKAIAVASSSRFGVGNSAFRVGGEEKEVDTVPFGTFRKRLFEKIGVYDERLVRNQDIELNSRIRSNGGKIIISPEIKLKYYNRATYKGLVLQAFSNGLWNPYTVWLVGGSLSVRHFIPMAFVLSLIIFSIGAVFYLSVLLLLGVELFFYMTFAAFFALRVSKSDHVSFWGVLWSFFVLHCAYGLGSLWGVITVLFKFPNRKSSKK